MSCQHPNCSRPIHSICTNHCHWSLCQEHLNEHTKSLLLDFEQALQDIIKPTNEISKSIEQTKQTLQESQQTELHYLEQKYKNQMNKIDQRLIKVKEFQEDFNKKSEYLIKIKTNQNILTQNDFQQMEILSNQLNEYKNSLTDKFEQEEEEEVVEEVEEVEVEKEEENIVEQKDITKPSPKHFYRVNRCPLTTLNIFGLTSAHNVRTCAQDKKIQHLFEHLRNYHHLTVDYANEILKAVTKNLDPRLTNIFPVDTNITVVDDKQPCPLHDTPSGSRIRCTPCRSMLTEKLLRPHLSCVHRLSLEKIKEILKTN